MSQLAGGPVTLRRGDLADRRAAGLPTSNREISAAAGQGNTAAVNYHFGSKTDLVLVIARRHTEQVERLRAECVARTEGSTDLPDWIACMVRPLTEHLDALGTRTWSALASSLIDALTGLWNAQVTR